MIAQEVSDGGHYMDQAALDQPPSAPSKYMFIVPAVAYVGQTQFPDWNNAERTPLNASGEADAVSVATIQSAASLLHQAIMDEKVTAYSRKSSGGALEPMTVDTWINDYMGTNIARSSGGPAFPGSVFIYVDRAELEREFATKGDAVVVAGITIDELSPYLRLAIAVSQKQAISDTSHSTVQSLTADLLAEAPNHGLSVGTGNSGFDLSPTWAEEIAKAIRWPAARLGSAKGGNQKP